MAKSKPPSAVVLRALRFIYHRNATMTPAEFAEYMWPASPAWRRSNKAGPYGSVIGGAMPRAGGAFLGRLVRAGWVYEEHPAQRPDLRIWRLTGKGKRALAAASRRGV